MSYRFVVALLLGTIAADAVANTTIVDDNFDGYANQAAFETVWRPDDGGGVNPVAGPTGILLPNTTGIPLTPPNDNPPGMQGKAVNILNDINEYIGAGTAAMATLIPTATQAVRVTGDFFDSAVGNKRASIGLRNKTSPSNLIELGMWNAPVFDPVDPANAPPNTPVENQPELGYAYRLQLFEDVGSPLVRNPNWQYFPLDPILDRPADADTLVTEADIGVGWHRYTATISLTEVTLTLDLFRDGLKNTAATAGVGSPGVDSSVTWQMTLSGAPDPFDSLRFGAPSGLTSVNQSVIDNIKLELIDLATAPTNNSDFDNDGDVDGADFLTWQKNSGLTGVADNVKSTGDANGDHAVNGTDLDIWKTKFGGVPETSVISAVPEPATAVAAIWGLLSLGAVCRRRSGAGR